MAFRQDVSFMDEGSCSGCGLCSVVCPTSSISLTPNERGFSVPFVDSSSCVGCGVCVNKCPSLFKPESSQTDTAYVARSLEANNLKKSTAGGMTKPLFETIIENGGVAYGAGYAPDWTVRHIACRSSSDSDKCAGSKYVQSDLLAEDVYEDIRQSLSHELPVLFSGLPCQTAAIRARFGDPAGLYLVDLVCHGVASPYLWDKYLDRFDRGAIKQIRFRNKTYGYHMSTMEIVSSGRAYRKSGRVDPYLKAFFSGIAHRKSCNECRFKGESRYSDLTLFDCSRFFELTGMHDDDCGYTNVLINSSKGMELIDMLDSGHVELIPIEKSEAVRLNGRMIAECTSRHPSTDLFYCEVAQSTLDRAIDKYIGSSKIDSLVEHSKSFLYKSGLLSVRRKLKEKKGANAKH